MLSNLCTHLHPTAIQLTAEGHAPSPLTYPYPTATDKTTTTGLRSTRVLKQSNKVLLQLVSCVCVCVCVCVCARVHECVYVLLQRASLDRSGSSEYMDLQIWLDLFYTLQTMIIGLLSFNIASTFAPYKPT